MQRCLKHSIAGRCLSAALAIPLAVGAVQPSVAASTTTPIQHVVVIFQENVSFDHYFATYPAALNPSGEPQFSARDDTPSVNGLGTLVEGRAGRRLAHRQSQCSQLGQWEQCDQPV